MNSPQEDSSLKLKSQNSPAIIDPLFGLENERRGPISKLLLTFSPFTIALIDLTTTYITGYRVLGSELYLAWYPSLTMYLVALSLKRSMPAQPTYDGDFWLKRTLDSFVVEYKSKPSTITEYRAHERFIHNKMFHFISSLGNTRAWFLGSGHIHVDLQSAFRQDSQLLRDFIVDLINHPSLYKGPFSADPFSARDPRIFLDLIKRIVRSFDNGGIQSFEELVEHLRNAGLSKEESSAISIRSNYPTIELRFFRSAKNTQEIFAFLELIKARLNYLKRNPGVQWKDPKYRLSRSEQYAELQTFVTQSGLDWETYKKIIPRWWRFLANFKISRSKAVTCEKYFHFAK